MQRKSILPTVVFYSLFYLDLDHKIIKNKDTQNFFSICTAFTFFTQKERKKKEHETNWDIGLGLIYLLMCKSFIFDLFEVQNRVLEPCI